MFKHITVKKKLSVFVVALFIVSLATGTYFSYDQGYAHGYIQGLAQAGGMPTISPDGISDMPWVNATAINVEEFYLNSEDKTDLLTYPEQAASYIIFKEGSTYYAKDASTGKIMISGTNATTVIQNALNGLTSGRTWQEKVVCKGNFSLSATISLPSYTIFEIQGILYLEDGSNCNIIENNDKTSGNTEISVFGGKIYGNKGGQTSGHGISFLNVTYCTISSVHIYDAKWMGIVIGSKIGETQYPSHYNIIQNSWVENCGAIGISIEELSSHNIITENVIKSNSMSGVALDTASHNTINSNEIYQNTQNGILVDSSSTWNLIGKNIIRRNSMNGINIVTDGSQHNLVESNIIISQTTNGIRIDAASDNRIIGNYIADNSWFGTNNYDGILIEDDADLNTIIGNIIRTPRQKYGIQIKTSDCDDNLVINNDLRSAGTTENLYDGGTGSIIKRNEGVITENEGEATILNGQTSIVVSHGCDYTPSTGDISVHPIEPLGNSAYWYIDTITSNQFTIHVNVDPGQDVDFAWSIDRH